VFGKPTAQNLQPTADFSQLTPNLDKSSVSLIQGENILAARGIYDHTERFQTYIVKGQSISDSAFNGKVAQQVFATAQDKSIGRNRKKTIIPQNSINFEDAKKRANWEAIVRAVKSTEAMITIQGWQKDDKKLWKINELVRVDAGFIGLNSEMLITGVTFRKSIDGTFTTLKLTRPDAYDASKDVVSDTQDPTNELGWQSEAIGPVYKKIKELIS
jgi:prophage tail gpP-like protein